ncbi:MAG: PTS system mannose/fructose/sorbose family transporter subunit IID, partial [Erysipelotrichaceae bacterium]|nr:PTS system mannose/fructose/sorbose family transporter subunit IID [Erysipelotrichaceae bacterium]
MAKTNKKLSKKALNRTMWRHANTLEWANNYERMQASGFAYAMLPVIEELYDTDEERSENLKRHLRFYNTH